MEATKLDNLIEAFQDLDRRIASQQEVPKHDTVAKAARAPGRRHTRPKEAKSLDTALEVL